MTQLPSLFGVAGGGQNFFERAVEFAGQLGQINFLVLAIGVVATGMLVLGQRFLPGRRVALAVVALAIVVALVFEFSAAGVPSTGKVPRGSRPSPGQHCGYAMLTEFFRLRLGVCCSPTSKAFRPPALSR